MFPGVNCTTCNSNDTYYLPQNSNTSTNTTQPPFNTTLLLYENNNVTAYGQIYTDKVCLSEEFCVEEMPIFVTDEIYSQAAVSM